MKLYNDNGYINMEGIIQQNLPFNFVVGGRGTGKTYGALKYCMDNHIKFIYMRRTDTIIQTLINSEFSPINPIAKDEESIVVTQKINKYITGFYDGMIDEQGKVIPESQIPFGCAVGLSVVGNMRGWDASDYQILIMDEFIAEKHEHYIKNESEVFFNAYETINRNRELKGEKPLQVLFLANANDLTNDYFLTLKLIDKADQILKKGLQYYIDIKRGLSIYLLHNSPISEKKAATALYKLTTQTDYSAMALNNDFVYEERTENNSRPLAEYRAVVQVGELVMYKHKSEMSYYGCLHLTGTCKSFGTTETELKRFTSVYHYLWSAYLQNSIVFETYTCEALFRKYWH